MTSSSNAVGGESGGVVLTDSTSGTLLEQALLGSGTRTVLMSGSRQEAQLDNARSRQQQPSPRTKSEPSRRNESQANTEASTAGNRAARTGAESLRKGSLPAMTVNPFAPRNGIAYTCFPTAIGTRYPTPTPSRPAQTAPAPGTAAAPIAASASTIAKARETMLKTVDDQLDSVLGKGKYTKPTDHRGYVALVAQAAKKLGTSKAGEEFKSKIELAGQPFRLNFGLSRTTGGKQVALNSNVAGPFGPLYQAEQKKFAAEFKSPAPSSRRTSAANPTTPTVPNVPTTPTTPTTPTNTKPTVRPASIQDVTDKTSMIA